MTTNHQPAPRATYDGLANLGMQLSFILTDQFGKYGITEITSVSALSTGWLPGILVERDLCDYAVVPMVHNTIVGDYAMWEVA